MTNKATKYGIMIIAAVVLVAIAFAGAVSAAGEIEPYYDTGSNTFIINETGHLVWMANQINAGNYASKKYTLDKNIDCGGEALTSIGTQSKPFSGIFEGNYKEISNFSISSTSSYVGLFGYYTGTRIANLIISNFSVSGSYSVGGLVGYAGSASEWAFENLSVKFGNVTGSSRIVGGLVGCAYSATKKFVNCTVENSVIASSGLYDENEGDCVGGLVGYANAEVFDLCKVVNCSVSGSNFVGGLVGSADYAKSGMQFMNGSSVINCVVSADYSYVGGLVGWDLDATAYGITECVVEKCTIVSAGSNNVGGMVGGTCMGSKFNAGNKLIASAVRGKNSGSDDYIGEVVGNDFYSKTDIADCSGNVTSDGNIWLNNNSNGNYPKIYIAKSTSRQGPETLNYFNEGLFADEVPEGAELVTELTGYGPNGQYAALGFVYSSSVPDYDIGSAVEWNTFAAKVNAGAMPFNVMNINITNSFSFEGVTPIVLGNSISRYMGNINGNGYTISNFVIDKPGLSYIGLVGYYTGGCIKDLTLSNFSVSGSYSVGGLVGYAYSASECTFENVSVVFGNVTGSSRYYVGGLVGYAYSVRNFKNCTTENSIIASSGNGGVGGLVGGIGYANFDICKVVNCSVSGSNYVGGLVGYAMSAISGMQFMNGSSVTNCIVSAGSNSVGGLVGGAYIATGDGINGCEVEKCTIVSAGSNNVGGLVGYAISTSSQFNAGNVLKSSAVRGNGTTVAKISGYNPILNEDNTNVTQDGSIWLNNNSNANYPKIYIAKSTSKPGTEKSEWFNGGKTADEVPYGAEIVTNLTGYGPNGQYAAFAYVYETEPEYPITNQTVQGIVLVQNASTSAGITNAKEGEKIHVLAVSNAGYYFDEWNVTNSTGLINVDDGNFTMPASPVNAGANFTPITYTVHFDANGGQGSMADMTFTYDVGQNLTANAFQRYNCNFLYWTTDDGNKYYNTEFVQNLTTEDGDTVVMTAQWEGYSTGGSSSGSTYLGSSDVSVILTQQPTAEPTPAIPTVIATEKPTTQTTQQSPAPFVGLLAGLGVAAVLLRLRK